MYSYNVKPITEVGDILWVGGNDRRLTYFENVYPLPHGVSYNAYLVLDEKTVLLDTVDKAIDALFYENITAALNGRTLDYLIVNHMEPDHCACIQTLCEKYPKMTVVCNAKTLTMLHQFFDYDFSARTMQIKEGDTLSTGRHNFTFVMAPMVHLPEAMVTYDSSDQILFSADAFGCFGSLDGRMFADEMKFETELLAEARRYYTNIVGKYGAQVQALLKKAAGLSIRVIAPLHGPVWRENIGWFLDKYQHWATYTPEDNAVMIACGSIYGHTEAAAEILASALVDLGIKDVMLYDVTHTDNSVLIAESFRCSHLVFASSTYNNGIFVKMEEFLHDLTAHAIQHRTLAVLENGSWAPNSGKLMRELLGKLKNCMLIEDTVQLRSGIKAPEREQLLALAKTIADSMQ